MNCLWICLEKFFIFLFYRFYFIIVMSPCSDSTHWTPVDAESQAQLLQRPMIAPWPVLAFPHASPRLAEVIAARGQSIYRFAACFKLLPSSCWISREKLSRARLLWKRAFPGGLRWKRVVGEGLLWKQASCKGLLWKRAFVRTNASLFDLIAFSWGFLLEY